MSANTGRLRLHPDDAVEAPGIGVFALSNGSVDLSKVPSHRETRRRTERQGVDALRAEIKRKSRHRNRKAA